jgi:hypothetical protein
MARFHLASPTLQPWSLTGPTRYSPHRRFSSIPTSVTMQSTTNGEHEIMPEAKPEVAHHEEPLNAVPEKEHPVQDGDISAKWLAEYTGLRRDITSQENSVVRNKVSTMVNEANWTESCRSTRSSSQCELGSVGHVTFADGLSIFYIYFTQQLDKSSLSFASVFGLTTDAHLQCVRSPQFRLPADAVAGARTTRGSVQSFTLPSSSSSRVSIPQTRGPRAKPQSPCTPWLSSR